MKILYVGAGPEEVRAAEILSVCSGIDARGCSTGPAAEVPLSPALISWADVVAVFGCVDVGAVAGKDVVGLPSGVGDPWSDIGLLSLAARWEVAGQPAIAAALRRGLVNPALRGFRR